MLVVFGMGLRRRRHHNVPIGLAFIPSRTTFPNPNFNSPTPPSPIQYLYTPPTNPVSNPTPSPPFDNKPYSPPPPPPEETAPANPPSVAAPHVNTPTPGYCAC
ncbi:hypothetical protein LR48_Vigan05g157800 [Vigna angularis]|uniref:Uncharacterized protein n=1 Tax=Phaseolus angularis TaxID=3914 RepID=A0A0L9UMM1_PHAAN|nr:hypothetical protein LR48_Vigan05g157800 [Vigna angularis]